jgi:hypothetical protein
VIYRACREGSIEQDMHNDPPYDIVACAGYGVINVTLRLIKDQLGILADRIRQGRYAEIELFLSTADSMTSAVTTISATPVWEDARNQLLALISQYRDLIALVPSRHGSLINAALGEVLETHAILVIARDRLAGRLGFGA